MAEPADRERNHSDIERLRETGDRLNRRAVSLEKEVAVLTERVEEVRIQLAQGFTALAVEGRFRQFTDIVSALQSNAYGERGSVLNAGNLLLAGNQLFWAMLNPVLQQAGMLTKSESGTLSMLTPVGSFITGQLLLANRQQERFISGIVTSDPSGVVTETLRNRIAAGDWNAFQQRADVPITLYVLDQPGFYARAVVTDGVLRIQVFPRRRQSPAGVRVAWMVDTGLGNG